LAIESIIEVDKQ